MKWFKHLTDASDNGDIMGIEERFGLDGYARWWKLLEAVAAIMDKGDTTCSVAYPWSKWQTILRGKRNKLETFLEHLENVSLITRKQTGNILEISVPKLALYRDNYSKKYVQDSDTVRTGVRTQESRDKSIDNTPLPPEGDGCVDEVPFSEPLPETPDDLPDLEAKEASEGSDEKPVSQEVPARRRPRGIKPARQYSEAFKRFHERYPNKVNKATSADLLDALLAAGTPEAEIHAGLDRYLVSEKWTKDGGRYVEAPDVWLRNRRFEDYPKPAMSVLPQKPVDPDRPKWLDEWLFGKGTHSDRSWAVVVVKRFSARLGVSYDELEVAAMAEAQGLIPTLTHYRELMVATYRERKEQEAANG